MATVAERQAERERRRREVEERKKREELAKQPGPDQVTIVGGDPNFQLGGGTFSILGIVENQALGGAQVISDQVQFKNAKDQRQLGGVVNQVVGGQPIQQNNQQMGQLPAGPNGQPNGQSNGQPNTQQAGAAGAQPGQDGQQPGQEKPAAEGDEPPDLLKTAAGFSDKHFIEVEVNIDAKGGKSRHRDFVNFLATDKVPGSIFGIPVVQDESQYTEKDLEFFRKNPKAAGFYDLGDEEVDEDVPQQAAKSKPSRGAYPGSLNNPGNVEKRKERRQGEVDSPHKRWAKFATPQDGLREMADAIRQIAAVKLAEKGQDFTIRNFAEVYAPRVNEKGEKENDTDKYIGDISADTGFGADEELARWDDEDMAKLLRSVVKFESGAEHSAWFTDEEYAAAAAKLQEGAFE